METYEREQMLHKLVAAGAFVFALSILPVAQYYLVPGNNSVEKGQVAGVSTEAPTSPSSSQILGNVPSNNWKNGQECRDTITQELNDLTKFENGKKLGLLRDYNTAVDPYKQAIGVLTGTPESISVEKNSLEGLIKTEDDKYSAKLTALDIAVSNQRASYQAVDCPTN